MSDYNNVVFSRDLTKKLLKKYRELRCLWDRDDENYGIKIKKLAALTQLTELVQQHDPNATRVHVLRKIESLRACVRREFKKVQASRRHATSEDDVHQPNLWYYNLLAFLFDNEAQVELKQKVDSSEDEEEETEALEEDQQDTYEIESYQSGEYNIPINVVELDRPSTSSKHKSFTEPDYKSKRSKTSTEVDDEYDAIGINVAAKLRYLPSNMRILAEKLINDVLFQAQTNGLNSSTKIVTMDPFKQETSSTTP